MKKIRIIASALLAVVMCSLTSCLGDSDTTDYSTYEDVAITSVSLGKLNRYTHKISSTGGDSIVKTTFTASSSYPMYVDQIKHTIYNPDSLPKGTDLAHVLVTFSTKSSAIVTIKDLTSDTVRTTSSSDSLDFSQARQLYVYSYNGLNKRIYNMQLNVHQEDADTFKWAAKPSLDILKNYNSLNVIHTTGNIMYVLGHNDSGSDLYQSNSTVSAEDTIFNLVNVQKYQANAQIVAGDDEKTQYYVLDNSKLFVSNTSLGSPTYNADNIASLIGVVNHKLYALTKDTTIVSTADYGQTWAKENIDEESTYLPTENINSVVATLATDAECNRITFVGNRGEAFNDTTAVVWSKLFDTDTKEEESFIYQDWTYNSIYKLPRLKNLSITMYNNEIMALGANTEGKFDYIYISDDHGLTWHKDDRFDLPKGFDAKGATLFAYGKYLWIFCSGSGQVWRGLLNNVGWTENQTLFQAKAVLED